MSFMAIPIALIFGLGGYYSYKNVNFNDVYSYFYKNDHLEMITDENDTDKIKIIYISEDNEIMKNYIQYYLEQICVFNSQDMNDDEITEEGQSYDIYAQEYFSDHKKDKIYVEYTLNNGKYSVCINGPIKIKQIEKSEQRQLFRRKILSAYILSKERDERLQVSKLVKEFQGPNADFYENVEGISKKIKDILYPYDLNEWDSLIITNIFGKVTEIKFEEIELIK